MWWSIVVVLKGESLEEAMANEGAWNCTYDGSVYGDREAKKMAKDSARDYIDMGSPGRPRLIKSPAMPAGARKVYEIERAVREKYNLPE
jgi:hypothetical protein